MRFYCNAAITDPDDLMEELFPGHGDEKRWPEIARQQEYVNRSGWRPFADCQPFYSISADQMGILWDADRAMLRPGHGLTSAHFETHTLPYGCCAHAFLYTLPLRFEVAVILEVDGSTWSAFARGLESEIQLFQRHQFTVEPNPTPYHPRAHKQLGAPQGRTWSLERRR